MPKRSSTSLTKRSVEGARAGQFLWDAHLPGFGLRVTEAGTRTFVAQFRTETGQQRRLTIGRYPTLTVDEARDEARKQLAKVCQGRDPSAERKAKRAEPTLNDRADHYWSEYGPARDLRPATLRDAKYVLTKHVLPTLGNRKIGEITIDDVRRFMVRPGRRLGHIRQIGCWHT